VLLALLAQTWLTLLRKRAFNAPTGH